MKAFGIRTTLATALVAATTVVAFSGAAITSAAGPPTPPNAVEATAPTVSGTLVARPFGQNPPPQCGPTAASKPAASLRARGLVLCSNQGNLVLLDLSGSTDLDARYGGHITVRQLTDGDHLNAWGTLQDNGMVLNPTADVQDVDVQYANTDSQDYITAHAGGVLTLMVLASDSGPVSGIVRAIRGGPVSVTLCGGKAGTWANLKPGKTIHISNSLFNSRTRIYLRTTTVRVDCP